jgi:hypothetical protein
VFRRWPICFSILISTPSLPSRHGFLEVVRKCLQRSSSVVRGSDGQHSRRRCRVDVFITRISPPAGMDVPLRSPSLTFSL